MLVISLLVFAVAGNASHVSGFSDRAAAKSRALAAAQAGMNIANYRLGKAAPRPADTQCFTTAPVAMSGGACPWSATEDLGNGAAIRYRISPVITSAATDTCAPQPVVIAYSRKQRCITAEATVIGQTRTVQRRVVQNFGGSPFPFLGAFGLSGVSINQSPLQGRSGRT
jgi:hypothetical protein